ncbi:hypothetical protein T440DRAFT_499319 [Plenodomus tracheiphilus IPT5]|uniref:Vacuolar import and degradation protein-domain-containing protein n=1 Tax=Plenodomus tracheiphilus IPT5 TaxID=1408161 RepID=A0A6A7B460_9PLEO|nr:hypothetical protein T440DRAFT_499319 [Plenodomus tracheiphilus IPT5]
MERHRPSAPRRMPPAASPVPRSQTPEHDTDVAPGQQDAEQPPSFISALRELESPVNEDVLNLAATLGTHAAAAAAAADDDDEIELELDISIEDPVTRLHALRGAQQQEYNDLRRDQELDRLSDNSAAAYGDRVPSRNSLYDWSPANEADDEDELDQILAELRREQPNTHPEILRFLGQTQLDSERARIRSISNRLQNQSTGPGGAGESLRSTAILQSVRRHPRFSARTREYLQRYQADRESASRNSPQNESRERYTSQEASRPPTMQRLSEGRTSLDRERRDMLSRADSYRRGFLDRTANATPAVSSVLEHTVKYLSRIRHSNSIDDSLNCALDAGFLSKDYFSPNSDFITDTSVIPPPAETSWLAPGAVLSGCQHATSVAAMMATTTAPGTTNALNRFRIVDGSGSTTPTTLPALPPPSRPWISNPYSTTRSPSQRLPEPQQPMNHQDRWPVKVTIHAVDWERMSLSATMEAYNVPSHPHTHQSVLSNSSTTYTSQTAQNHFTRTSSITTYLEGEILDFNTHTLLTESFKSTPGNDATYWRKLPPFTNMSDEDIVHALTSRQWFEQVLCKEWILMRWKERCFVKSLNKSTSDPALPPRHTPIPTTESSNYRPWPPSSQQPISQLQPSPYRIVRNSQTGRAEVEISHALLNTQREQVEEEPLASSDAEHASFDDSGCGLTISGFYYVCLRRRDGALEGLYYDPQSSPYQCLRLESVRGGLGGAWGFR